ncbi:MAG: glycosyl hydrolase [Bryobacteraceae bacterium]|nr:glycosyl hydrolase [Bryobacteraceae bacterium]
MPRAALVLFCLTLASAQAPPDAPDPTGYTPTPELKGLKFRNIGPAWGGRATRAAGVPGQPNLYYAAFAGSGIWKSADGGFTWKPIFDGQTTASVGSIAIAPSDPNVLYAGAGEANIRGNVQEGDGIYKSADAGRTWTHVWKQRGQIGAMAVHPSNPEIAFAAVLGRPFGASAERGVYRTNDGGRTWQQVLKKDENTGASDVALDPNNPHIVFAGLWQTRRFPWEMQSGGPGSGLYLSRDGGETWKQLTEKGLPKGIWGKVGVAVAPSDSRRVYALIEAEEGGLFRSDDGGDTWTRISASRLVRQRAWYYSTLTVNPANADDVWFPSVPMVRTIDGGKTLTVFGQRQTFSHGDHHDHWIDPRNPQRMINAHDGGVDISTNGGETWFSPALPVSQFYHVAADNRTPFHVAGAMQDIGTAQGPSDSLSSGGIRNTDWYSVGGGEAGHVASDPSDPNIVYAGEYGGIITHYDHRTRQARNVSAYPENPSGHGGEDLKYRFQWTAPILVSPHDPKMVYHAANVLFRSTDGGQSWTPISGDLTRNDKTKQKWSGGPITGDNTGVEIYGTIFAVAESPLTKGLIWAGTDDGLVHLTRDAGKTWKNVTAGLNGLPQWATIRVIEPSRFDAGTAYLVADNHRLDDVRPYLYKTSDFGATWTRLDASLPQDVYLHVVREDPSDRNFLYLGTERGVAYSRDGGKTWLSLRSNLPTVSAHDLVIKNDSLIVGTMGRSIYILDHLSPLREYTRETALLRIPDATAWQRDGRPRDRFSGENPPAGASIYYFLKEPAKGEIKIEILDSANRVIRTLSSKPETPVGSSEYTAILAEAFKKAALPNEAGLNRGVWDLRHKGADMIPGGKVDMGDARLGPLALPGAYTVRLTVDGKSYQQPLKVSSDPRETVSQADRAAQFQLALEMRDSVSRITKIVNDVRSVRKQLTDRNALLESNARAEQVRKDSLTIITALDKLEDDLHNKAAEVVYDILAFKGGTKLYSRMIWTYTQLTDGTGAPTQGVKEVYADQKAELGKYDSQYKRILDADLGSLNLAARKLELPHIIVP